MRLGIAATRDPADPVIVEPFPRDLRARHTAPRDPGPDDRHDGRFHRRGWSRATTPAPLQGAIVSLLAEAAAEELATRVLGRPCRVADVDIRYLAMARVGPVWTRAHWIGPEGSGSVRVELRDRGNGDRVTAAVLARVVSA
jgi:hypothetical protein